jgi:acetyl-CoA hydrolase
MKVLELEALEFAAVVKTGDRVAWGQAGAEPLALTRALMAQRAAIRRFSAFIGISWSDMVNPEHADHVQFTSYCGAGHNRRLAQAGLLDVLPCHYSELPDMIRTGRLKIDVLMLQVAPPDSNGRFSLSIAHEYLVAALGAARVVVAEINDQAPWTFGERSLAESDIDIAVFTSRTPLTPKSSAPSADELAVGRRVAALIADGSTLQFGIGSQPEAVLQSLGGHRNLGVHSGALLDAVAELAAQGIINNEKKSVDPGLTVAGVMLGGRSVYDYAHQNPRVQFRSVDYTHSAQVLAAQDRFVSINSAIEVDLTGQINAEVAGGVYVGAVGGAIDFMRGAHRSKGGLPIVALPSTAGSGARRASRIVARLSGPVSTPRSDAGFIVTEHGVADLRGLSLSQRIPLMIALADDEFRDGLAEAARAG